uniref:ATP-binding cassette sub-family A member 3-like n=1 Tax=Phallusia mammillata TaxID=59560 RepID=A0A6F9D631_9ASCI|nr:ATP-binding cassette sub-family A member 3-like [Phallusia mammillata]
MGALDKLSLLIWKNFLLQKRRPIATVIELLLPIFYTIILVIIRDAIDVTNHPNSTTWREFKVDTLPEFSVGTLPDNLKWKIAYAPNDVAFCNDVMQSVETKLNQIPLTRVERQCGIGIPLFLQIMENPANAFTLLNSAPPSGPPGPMGGSAMNPAALAAYNSFPRALQTVVDEMAAKANTTRNQILMVPIVNNNMANFTAQLVGTYINKTSMCFVGSSMQYLGVSSNTSSGGSGGMDMDVSTKDLLSFLSIVPKVSLEPFSSEQTFLDFAENETNLNTVLACAIFDGDFSNTSITSDKLKLTLRFQADPLNSQSKNPFAGGVSRWVTHLLFPSFQVTRPRSDRDPTGGRPGYYKEGMCSK